MNFLLRHVSHWFCISPEYKKHIKISYKFELCINANFIVLGIQAIYNKRCFSLVPFLVASLLYVIDHADGRKKI